MSTTGSSQPPIPFSATLHVRDHCLCFQAQRAARGLARLFDRAFQPFGIGNQQFSLMMALNRPEPPSVGQLGRELGMDRTTVTAAVKVLSARGLIGSLPQAGDRRVQRLQLTPEGMALLAAALPVWEATLSRLQAAGGGEIAAASAILQGLSEACREAASPAAAAPARPQDRP